MARLRRAIRPGDAATLRTLQVICLPTDDPLETTEGQWWLAFEGKEPVAFCGLTRSAQWLNVGYLCRAGVLHSQRGKHLQRRLIRVRLAQAKRLGYQWCITDTCNNPASANSLIACGFKMYLPRAPWGLRKSIYWRKALK